MQVDPEQQPAWILLNDRPMRVHRTRSGVFSKFAPVFLKVLMIIDFDFPSDALKAWDFSIRWDGVNYPVKCPTALQLAKICDCANAAKETACRAQINLLHELTGIDLVVCEQVDSVILKAFIEGIGDAVVKVLNVRNQDRIRHQQKAVDTTMASATKTLN